MSPLRQALAERGMTAADLCKAAGLGDSAVHSWLSGRVQPTTASAVRVAQTLGRPVHVLFPDLPAATALTLALAGRGLTVRQVAAAAAGVSVASLYTWARGVRAPTAGDAATIAAVVGLPADQLFPTLRPGPAAPAPAATLTVAQALAAPAAGDPHWERQAACATGGHDPDLWWPATPAAVEAARQVCAGCPVIGDCRDSFLAGSARLRGPARDEMDAGVWAGVKGAALRAAARRQTGGADRTPPTDAVAREGSGPPAAPRPSHRDGAAPRTRLEAVLAARGLSDSAAARTAGLSAGMVSRWARGDSLPTIGPATQLADALGVTVNDLFDRTRAYNSSRAMTR
ncbi:MAG: helix-turn-helix domain-containing protein [Egibacteraceae bacterium]